MSPLWLSSPQVLLDKNTPQIRTVVNKIGTIENVFRTFPMEVVTISVMHRRGNDERMDESINKKIVLKNY